MRGITVVGTVNDNENGFFKTPITMNNDNDIDARFVKSRNVERLADMLVDTYNNKDFRSFYCKVAWKLSEAKIQSNIEQSFKGNNPARLFTYLCKRDGV